MVAGGLEDGGGGTEMDGVGVWDEQMPTIIYRMDQQGPTVEHRELYPVFWDKP